MKTSGRLEDMFKERLDTSTAVPDGLLFLQIKLDDLLNLLYFWVLYVHSTPEVF